MIAVWGRLPVILRAVIAGSLVSAAGTIPWALLASANLRFLTNVPWAVVPAGVYLWFFWRYVRGEGWPRSTAEARRTSVRANPLSDDLWGAAFFAGVLGLVALVLFLPVMNRLVRLPAQPVDDLSRVPGLTLVACLLMGSIVAGVVEEAAFRGYMQGPIERRHGPVIAILVTGSMFGVAHLTHPEVTLVLMPYYLAVAAVYGALAYFTNSIFPSMVLHAGGNMLSYLDLLARGRAEWQASPIPPPLIWETGPDSSFWTACAAFLIAGSAAVWAYSMLATARAPRRRSTAATAPSPMSRV